MLGDELRWRRKAAGSNQADFTARLGSSRDFVDLMERGPAPIASRWRSPQLGAKQP